eukprot:m.237174 g.237174  ORF g.237174 m.237174 type:complete len:211 (-) comp19365_c2_seq1:1088-1720(-)
MPSLPPPTEAERMKHSGTFRKLSPADGKIPGRVFKALWAKTGLDGSKLAKIWQLADKDRDTKLNLEEFVVGMHLVTLAIRGDMQEIPKSLDFQPVEVAPTHQAIAEKTTRTVALDVLAIQIARIAVKSPHITSQPYGPGCGSNEQSNDLLSGVAVGRGACSSRDVSPITAQSALSIACVSKQGLRQPDCCRASVDPTRVQTDARWPNLRK